MGSAGLKRLGMYSTLNEMPDARMRWDIWRSRDARWGRVEGQESRREA
jgi:hypothetical protein